jgi:hypothetical protein
MRIEKHPFGFDVCDQFPNARPFRGWEGGCAYRAEREGKAFVIIDEGTMADFLDECDPQEREVLKQLVSVIEFDNEAEREAFITDQMRFGTDLEKPPWLQA